MNSLHYKSICLIFITSLIISLFAYQPTTTHAQSALSAVWANDGGDKVTQDELRATNNPNGVFNSVWNGNQVSIFGAKNEVVSFNLILEAGQGTAQNVAVSFDRLDGPDGYSIATTGDDLFNWTNRPIELFYVRYLQILGASRLAYYAYDERHIPERFQRPWTGNGVGQGDWYDRPDADKYYPDIAVPIEMHSTFTVEAGQNQSIWADIYIPKDAPPGIYTGQVTITENGTNTRTVPVELIVRNFTLPDEPTTPTMLYIGYEAINMRYIGEEYSRDRERVNRVRDLHFMLAHRHKISMIDSNFGVGYWYEDRPRPEWIPRLDGSLFTPANGYDGPGVGQGNGVFSIGTYGSWQWRGEGEASMHFHTDNWVTWFEENFPDTDYFLYLIDESLDFEQTERWAQWIDSNPGPGSRMPAFATIQAPEAVAFTPSVDVVASFSPEGTPQEWQHAVDTIQGDPDNMFFLYNGRRPTTGSFATEDDGVAPRMLPWTQYKLGVDRWFFWEATHYNRAREGGSQTNVFEQALTAGWIERIHPYLGEFGTNYTNGDGLLMYPGTDTIYPEESYGLEGPIASLRLKHWRRGIQDADYLALAAAIDPAATQEIINNMIPSVAWEVGVVDPGSRTGTLNQVDWSNNPDDWEAARLALANIIDPTEPVGIAPSGQINDNRPEFTWQAGDASSNTYNLWVNNQNGDRIISEWYSATDVCHAGMCSVRVNIDLSAGDYNWWVRGSRTPTGAAPEPQASPSPTYTDWSPIRSFTVAPAIPTAYNPSGSITNRAPNFEWQSVANADWYQVLLSDGEGNTISREWYKASLHCSGSTCHAPTANTLQPGDYRWWVRSWTNNVESDWSAMIEFKLDIVPGTVTLNTPYGEVAENMPTYTWQAAQDTIWYNLRVDDANGINLINEWHRHDNVCGGTQCSVTPQVSLANGLNYSWWVRGYNDAAMGAWSTPLTINRPLTAPILTAPYGPITVQQPTYTWNVATGATWYQVRVLDAGNNEVMSEWHKASNVCGAGTCVINPSMPLTADAPYTWSVRGWANESFSAWSDNVSMSYMSAAQPAAMQVPTQAILISPAGAITTQEPVFQWYASLNADTYEIVLLEKATNITIYSNPYNAGEICGDGICQTSLPYSLNSGEYEWWIIPTNVAGSGLPSAETLTFFVP